LKVSKFQNHRIKLTLFISICPYCLLSNHRQKSVFRLTNCKVKNLFLFTQKRTTKKIKNTSHSLPGIVFNTNVCVWYSSRMPGIVFDTHICVGRFFVVWLPPPFCRVSFSIPMLAHDASLLSGCPSFRRVLFSIPMRTGVLSHCLLGIVFDTCDYVVVFTFSVPTLWVGIVFDTHDWTSVSSLDFRISFSIPMYVGEAPIAMMSLSNKFFC